MPQQKHEGTKNGSSAPINIDLIIDIPPETTAKVKTSTRWKHAAANSVVPNIIFDGLGFWAPKVAEAIDRFLPAPVQVALPLANFIVGFGLIPQLEALVKEAIKKCQGSSPYKLLPPPLLPEKLQEEVEQNCKLAGVAISSTIVYTALNTLRKYSNPEVAAAILKQLPPIATPLFIATVGYGVGKLCYDAWTQYQSNAPEPEDSNLTIVLRG